ncbi:MAG TPA: response regulator transcription factor [Polyangiaceae bacterium]|nr:response regulator transcription factor [Polyangiaceae bacterium]
MRGIVCEFKSYSALEQVLAHGREERDLDMPHCEAVRDGEWLVVTVVVGEESTTVAGRVDERADGFRLFFEERDWERLQGFAEEAAPPSLPPAERANVPHPVRAAPGTRVLLVDDDDAQQNIVGTMLEASGMHAVSAGTAEEAWQLLTTTDVDLLVLDWSLPGMSGLELCHKLRGDARFGALPILFLTAHSSSDDLVTAFEAGADDFVSKPFRAPELKARVLGLLRRTQAPAAAAVAH